MLRGLLAGALFATSGGAALAQVPLPLARPKAMDASPRLAPIPVSRQTPPAKAIAPAVPGASEAARVPMQGIPDAATPAAPCTELLAGGFATAELSASISGISGGAFCGDEAPVRLSAVQLRDGSRVELRPAAVARCEMALTFARWVRDDLAATVRLLGAGLRRIDIAASYTCRPRNNIKGAKLSEHGKANAIDVGAIGLDDGRRIAIDDRKAPPFLFGEMRLSSCARFTTVLGPGSDAAHANHLHLDLAQRRGGYRLCQWSHADWLIP